MISMSLIDLSEEDRKTTLKVLMSQISSVGTLKYRPLDTIKQSEIEVSNDEFVTNLNHKLNQYMEYDVNWQYMKVSRTPADTIVEVDGFTTIYVITIHSNLSEEKTELALITCKRRTFY